MATAGEVVDVAALGLRFEFRATAEQTGGVFFILAFGMIVAILRISLGSISSCSAPWSSASPA